jgi:16S rRNA (guanine527-N7)-methyltransferase
MTDPPGRVDDLLPWLAEAQQRGFIGPGDIEPHIDHAAGFLQAAGAPPLNLLDLGSGAGIPGLILAAWWPETRVVLLDAAEKRTTFLDEAISGLDWQAQISVVRGRAEEVARDARFRSAFEMVTARSFGPPAVVAECAAGFLAMGGRLLVSEPPDGTGDRWAAPEPLAELGLAVEGSPSFGVAVLRQVAPCPDRWPRRVGIPAKRPLF